MSRTSDGSKENHFQKFFVPAIVVLIYTLVVGAIGNTATMGIGAFLAVVLLLFSMIDKFSSIKASATGIEAELRKVKEDAEVAAEDARKMAILLGKLHIDLLVRTGRMGFPHSEKEKGWKQIIATLTEMGVPEEEREKAMEVVYRFTRWDLFRRTINPIAQVPNEFAQEYNTLSSRQVENPATPDEVEAFLTKAGLLDDERRERLADYRHYLQKKSLRRPIDER